MKDSNDKKTIDMLKPAPKTNAERQRAYREKIKNNNSQRLDVYLDKSVADKLADIVAAVGLASHFAKTERVVKAAVGHDQHRRGTFPLHGVVNPTIRFLR